MKKLFKTVIAVLLIIVTIASIIACGKKAKSRIDKAKEKVIEICQNYLDFEISSSEAVEKLTDIYKTVGNEYIFFRESLAGLIKQIENKDFDPNIFKEDLNEFKKSDLDKTADDIGEGKYSDFFDGTVYMQKKPFMLKVLSDSMAPTIYEGDIIGISPVEDASALKVGDIIVYWTIINGERVISTHRIISIYDGGDHLMFETRGDNNPRPDELKVHEAEIIGIFDKVLFRAKKGS